MPHPLSAVLPAREEIGRRGVAGTVAFRALVRLMRLLFLSLFLLTASGHAAERPNILFILLDDMGWTDAGCYGSDFIETENIDRLAKDGMRFTDAYAACNVCSPTRSSPS